MAEGIGLSIDTSFLKKLTEADKLLAKMHNSSNKLKSSTISAFQAMTQQGVMPFVESLEKQKKMFEEIGKIKDVGGGGRVFKSLQKDAKNTVDELNKVIAVLQKTKAYRGESTGRNAISFANSVLGKRGEAKSINNMQLAIRQLEDAQNRLNLNTKTGQKNYEKIGDTIKKVKAELDKAKGSSDNLNKSHRDLLNIGDQVARKIALVFSVSQVTGYIKKLAEVRGEFELQQKSLQAIIQNIDEANKLWEKTVALAVKSPFRVKELVTYTKQLAAYRVETDKLYDTTKMLADVSAGLGVDMNRLILAFGQVKAANYLRGTELRQFSEAGINILGELAKYFTELEGRAVSVGDVFERVSKRMVSFADVEEIFKRITSEGGVFYNMQELQAETLKGQISNLRDAIDIMLNDIGKANEDTMKGMIRSVRGLVENWEYLGVIIKDVAVATMLTTIVKFGKGVFSMGDAFEELIEKGKGVTAMGAKLRVTFTKLVTAIATHPWIALGTALASVIVLLVQMGKVANKTKRELAEIELQGAFDASKSIAEYKRLADVVSDTSKSYEEQKKALSTLQSKYRDVLPDHLLQAEAIRDLKGNYDEATNAIREYIAAKTKEKQIAKVEETYGDRVNTRYTTFAEALRKRISAIADANVTLSDVTPIVDKIREGFESGEITLDNYDTKLKELIKTHSGLDVSILKDYHDALYASANDFIIAVDNMNNAIEGISGKSLEWGDLKKRFDPIYEQFNAVRDEAEETKNSISGLLLVLRDYGKVDAQGNALVTDETYNDTISKLNKMFEEVGIKGVKWQEIINDPFKLQKTTTDYNIALWGNMIKQINDMPMLPSQTGAKSNFVEMLMGEQKAFKGTNFQQEVSRILLGLSDEMKVGLTGLDSLFASSEQSVADYAKTVESSLDRLKTSVAEYDNDVANGVGFSPYDPAQVDLMREQIPLVEEYLKLFEIYLTKKPSNDEDTFAPQLRVVKEIYEEYKKLSKLFDNTTAKAGAIEKFGDAFKDAFGKTPEAMGFDLFSQEGIEAAYNYLISRAPDAKKKIQAELAKGEVVWDLKIKTREKDNEQLAKDIQDMLDQYDLSLELKKLNIPPDVAKSLFGVESIGLEDIRKKVQKELDAAKLVGGNEDRIKQLEKDLEKINDMEDKAQIERLQTYLKYTRAAIGERAKIKAEELTKLKEIEDTFRKAEEKAETEADKKRIREQEALAKSGVRREANEAMSKMEWEEFRKSETFISLFDDLEGASDAILKKAIQDLDSFKKEWKDLPLDQMKEVIELRNKAQRALESKESPWGEVERLKGLISTDGRTREQAELDSYNAEQEKARLEKELEMIGLINQKRAEGTTNEELKIVLGEKYSHLLDENVNLVDREKELTEDLIPAQDKAIDRAQDRIQNEKDLIDAYKKQADTLREIQGMANDLYESFKELSEALGGDQDSPASIFADMGMSMASSVLNAIMLSAQLKTIETGAMAAGTALNAAMGIIGWIVMGVQIITQIISAIAKMKDNKIVAQLEEQAKIIEKQRDLYKEIEERVDKAYSVDQLRQYNDELERNIALEIQAIEASIALERSRKNADEGQIADWQKEIDEARKRLEESAQEMKETVGGIFDLEDFTRGFVDAWWDAMEEGMDGLDALKDHFEDTMKDLVKKQALYKGAQKILEQVVNAIKADLEGDFAIDDWEEIERIAKKANIDLDAFLQGYKDIFDSISSPEASGLSALQKGIGSASEESIQVLTAYWNSVRQYTANIDSKMDLVLANMNVTSEDNPMLAQLMITARQTTAINTLLSSVTKGGHSEGGVGIKVFMN